MRSLIEKAFFLKQNSLFRELELELLLAIAEKLHEDHYDQNEKVFSIGQVANRLYFIAKGQVKIIDDQNNELCTLGTTDHFGDESLFTNQPRAYCAKCTTDTTFLTLSRSHLLSIISECPSVAVSLLQSYARCLSCRFERIRS